MVVKTFRSGDLHIPSWLLAHVSINHILKGFAAVTRHKIIIIEFGELRSSDSERFNPGEEVGQLIFHKYIAAYVKDSVNGIG